MRRCTRCRRSGMNRMKNNIVVKSFWELFCASKTKFLFVYFLTLIQGLSKILPIVTIQQLFDHLELLNEDSGMIRVSYYLFAFVGARCFCHVLNMITNYVYEAYNNYSAFGMNDNVNRTVAEITAIKFETPSFLDSITKAYRGTSSIRGFVDTWMMIVLLYVPELVTILAYLCRANRFLPGILLFIVIPTIIIMKLQEKAYTIQEEQVSVLQRKKEVYQEHAFHLKNHIESSVWNYIPLLKEKICRCNVASAEQEFLYENRKNRLDNYQKLVSLTGYGLIFTSLSLCVSKGFITIGLFSALITSLDELFEMMEIMISMISEGMAEEMEKIRKYFQFMEEEKLSDCNGKLKLDGEVRKIEFRNVSFSYPGKKEKALDNISFVIEGKESIAIVGKNGSGKSTLIKLLSGIYECDEGVVLINDVDVKRIDKKCLYDHFSTVFQKYGRYALTFAENISLSEEIDGARIEELLEKEGLMELRKVDKETILSREFGGGDLSGGQWQRIAIARGYYRNRDCYLLDEPTSAIDPNKEKLLYKLFLEMMQNKLGFIVTHRMAFAQLADRVLVMDGGQLVEIGNHKQLLNTCEKYRQLWFSQADIYVK